MSETIERPDCYYDDDDVKTEYLDTTHVLLKCWPYFGENIC